MPRRRRRDTAPDPIEEALHRAGSIGTLERLAGLDPSPDARTAFWRRYAHLPGAQARDAGVAELRRRIAAAASTAGRT